MARTAVIVAHDVDVVAVLRGRMAAAGYRPIWASDAGEAIAAITHEKPALVLIDVTEPCVRGWELITKLDRSPALARIPRVVLGHGRPRRPGAHPQLTV